MSARDALRDAVAAFGPDELRELGLPRVVPGEHVVFAGACGLTAQLAARACRAGHRGAVRVYDPESEGSGVSESRPGVSDGFGALMSDVDRASIDGALRLVCLPRADEVPSGHLKRLVACPHVWVVGAARPAAAPRLSGLLRVVRVARVPRALAAAVAGVSSGRSGGLRGMVDFGRPEDTAMRLLASGAPRGAVLRAMLAVAMEVSGDAGNTDSYTLVGLCSACDAAMARCRRALALPKLLEVCVRQMAAVLSSSSSAESSEDPSGGPLLYDQVSGDSAMSNPMSQKGSSGSKPSLPSGRAGSRAVRVSSSCVR